MLAKSNTRRKLTSHTDAKTHKKGGGDLALIEDNKKVDRKQLFINVLKQMETGCDSAMELLVELHHYASNNDNDIKELLEEVCTYDTVSSLAIVLQPCAKEPNYLSNDFLVAFAQETYKQDITVDHFKNSNVFTLSTCPTKHYAEIVKKGINNDVNLDEEKLLESVSSVKSKLSKLRQSSKDSKLLAEAELRALSTIILDNSISCKEYAEEMQDLCCNKCKLDSSYFCTLNDKELQIPFYFSVINLIVNSDSMLKNNNENRELHRLIREPKTKFNMNKFFEERRSACRDASEKKVKDAAGCNWRS